MDLDWTGSFQLNPFHTLAGGGGAPLPQPAEAGAAEGWSPRAQPPRGAGNGRSPCGVAAGPAAAVRPSSFPTDWGPGHVPRGGGVENIRALHVPQSIQTRRVGSRSMAAASRNGADDPGRIFPNCILLIVMPTRQPISVRLIVIDS